MRCELACVRRIVYGIIGFGKHPDLQPTQAAPGVVVRLLCFLPMELFYDSEMKPAYELYKSECFAPDGHRSTIYRSTVEEIIRLREFHILSMLSILVAVPRQAITYRHKCHAYVQYLGGFEPQ